jgi:glyoxylase-like metal-dependent hydrolase (beta-lactamase superfamily II)
MVEEIIPNVCKVEVPLPRNPLKFTNSYIIKGDGRFLVIDTAMNRDECMEPMMNSLNELKVDLQRTDFFITHYHVDHIGLVARLVGKDCKVFFNKPEADILNAGDAARAKHLDEIKSMYLSHGFPKDELEYAMRNHPGVKYGLREHVNFSILHEDDRLQIGDYAFQCIETHGHSPGHLCLYEPSKKILIAGDHILSDITPNISPELEDQNPLGDYLQSLDKTYSLDVDLVLTGHRRSISDHKKRIDELKAHHQARFQEIFDALKDGKKDAYRIASLLTWDVDCTSWSSFPPVQKTFAVGETIAHLKHLERSEQIQRFLQDGYIYFRF